MSKRAIAVVEEQDMKTSTLATKEAMAKRKVLAGRIRDRMASLRQPRSRTSGLSSSDSAGFSASPLDLHVALPGKSLPMIASLGKVVLDNYLCFIPALW
jgi:hypothetical protein